MILTNESNFFEKNGGRRRRRGEARIWAPARKEKAAAHSFEEFFSKLLNVITRVQNLLLSSTLPDSICQREITLNLCLCCNEKAKRKKREHVSESFKAAFFSRYKAQTIKNVSPMWLFLH
jgi:hypothetical protein